MYHKQAHAGGRGHGTDEEAEIDPDAQFVNLDNPAYDLSPDELYDYIHQYKDNHSDDSDDDRYVDKFKLQRLATIYRPKHAGRDDYLDQREPQTMKYIRRQESKSLGNALFGRASQPPVQPE